MRRIPIQTGASRYEAIVGSDLLAAAGELIAPHLRGRRGAIIADENTAARFAGTVQGSLRVAGFETSLITVPAGEHSKSLRRLEAVSEEMAARGLDRSSFVVALGGGVVGDLAGLAAAIFHRGIPWVQIPTTLLAQVDSSIGGKTAVNLAAGKNLLGAIHQPVVVLADTDALRTLPARELNQGFAEVIKHACIADPALFDLLAGLEQSDFAELVARNIEIKAAIVAQDEREISGARSVLNFGHTVGHAIEQASGYGALRHGEAVSLGMVAACEVSRRKAGLKAAEVDQVVQALERFGLPIRLPSEFPREKIMPALQSDKKFQDGAVRFVVTPRLGSAHLTSEVTWEDIEQAVARL